MADKEIPPVPPEVPKPADDLAETAKVNPGNASAAEVPTADETILALYYSGDIYVQMCFWLAYVLVILCVAVWLSWRLFGREVSEILTMQGYQTDGKPQDNVTGERSEQMHQKAE